LESLQGDGPERAAFVEALVRASGGWTAAEEHWEKVVQAALRSLGEPSRAEAVAIEAIAPFVIDVSATPEAGAH
jgi:hypothetical protein